MSDSFDRFFQVVPGRRDSGSRPSGRLWCPAADVYRTRAGWLVKVDLAGISPDDIEIRIAGPLLSISGSRRDSICGEGISHYQLEITYSRFEKTIQFPRSIDRATIHRDYRDGLLILQLQMEEESHSDQARAASGK